MLHQELWENLKAAWAGTMGGEVPLVYILVIRFRRIPSTRRSQHLLRISFTCGISAILAYKFLSMPLVRFHGESSQPLSAESSAFCRPEKTGNELQSQWEKKKQHTDFFLGDKNFSSFYYSLCFTLFFFSTLMFPFFVFPDDFLGHLSFHTFPSVFLLCVFIFSLTA